MLLAAGCSRPAPAVVPAKTGLRAISLQTDWVPQAEHGGFYQALARGFYAEAGLAVDIRPGGRGMVVKVAVAKGDADFGLSRSDDVIVFASHGLPLVMVAATFQHDPQALMVRAESPVQTLADLAGHTVSAPLSMTWIPYVQKKYGIKFNLTPMSGLAGFLADPTAIQQCLVTSEPFYAQQRGVAVRTLLLAAAGYDNYHAMFCRRELARSEPEVVRAFVAASIRGWRDYLEGDPTPAHALILQRNPEMSRELLAFSRGEMIRQSLVTGDRALGEDIGQLSLERVAGEIKTLRDMQVLEASLDVAAVATRGFLPAARR